MKVKEIFETGLNLAVMVDPRGKKGVAEYLKRIKKNYDNLSAKEKPYFDEDLLTNPYSDSKIHVDDKKTEVKRILTGIDIDSGEILLASQLNERGKKIDLIIAHHPIGKGLSDLHEVMDMQAAGLQEAGVPIHVAEKLLDDRIRQIGRRLHANNSYQLVNLAELLRINIINTHTFTDNLVNDFLKKFLDKKQPETLADLVDVLLEIPEYQMAKHQGFGPTIVAGQGRHHVGKYILEMTGGTEIGDKIYKQLSNHGISTVISMHMSEDGHKMVNEHNMNVVIAGHIASDSLGMNLFLDELEKKGIEIVPCGGLIRVSRVKKTK